MSNEEAIEVIKFGRCYDICFHKEYEEAVNMAIKALEQEPTLNKIRAEIVDLAQRTMNDNRAGGMWTCIDILDKYKAESER